MSEPLIRLSCFVGVLLIVALAERLAPRRQPVMPLAQRWRNHLSLVVLDTVLLRVVFPMAAVGVAGMGQTQGWGFFNILSVPHWVALLGSFVALDFIIYLQHVFCHALPLLWQFHRVHHADLDFDVTTALRFHPGEILLSMGLKIIAVVLLGAPPLAVLVFEIVLNATALFNHSNVSLPAPCDRILRLVLITPDFHRVHHSMLPSETNSNYGFNLPWWDYVLGTYCAQPQQAHEAMPLGLEEFRTEAVEQLPWMLMAPFYRH